MVKFNHSTPDQLGRRLRDAYRTAKGVQAGRISEWLLGRDNAELRALFGLSVAEVAQLRGRMQSRANAHQAVQSQVGE